MKRIATLLIGLWLAAAAAFAVVNETLKTAQEMLINATTLSDYKRAKDKFLTAKQDVAYVAAQHDEAISRGVKECDDKISQFSAKVIVNGSASPEVGFEAAGGTATLDVRSKQGGRIKTKSSAPWLTVESVAKDSIAITCEPNLGKEPRTATVTVSVGGASLKVKVSQQFVEYVISDIKFASADLNGTEIVRPGLPLHAEELLYLVPQFKISGVQPPVEKKFSGRLYDSEKRLVASDSLKLTLWRNETVVKFPGHGDDLPGSWAPGTYRYEVWVNDKKEATQHFTISSKGLTIWQVDFASADKKGNPTSIYGTPLYEEDTRTIRPRIIYCGAEDRLYNLKVKVYREGTLDQNKKSPTEYSYTETALLHPGTNQYIMPAWGTGKKGAYPEGEYRYEIWTEDGKLLHTSKFYVASKRNPLQITNVEYANADKDENGKLLTDYGAELNSAELQHLQPRLTYSGLANGKKKTVSVRIYKPDGSMMRRPDSPADFTYSCRLMFKPGENKAEPAAYGSVAPGTFAPGEYTIEYWVDGMLQYKDLITIH